MKKHLKKTYKGQITIFFSLISIIMFTVIFGVLEVSRIICIRTQTNIAANSTLESVFTQYNKDLFQKYHLLFLQEDQYILSDLKEYLTYYAEPAKGISVGGSYCKFNVTDVQIQGQKTAVEEGAYAIQKEIQEYVGYNNDIKINSEIKRALNFLQENEDIDIDINQVITESEEILERETENSMESEGKDNQDQNEEKDSIKDEKKINLSEFLSIVKNIQKEGILALVSMDNKEISARNIDKHNILSDDKNLKSQLKISNSENINAYIMELMPCYLDNDNDNYDLEYILGNSYTDRKNLEKVLKRLLVLRQSMNFVYISTDSQKNQEVDTMTEMILGTTDSTILKQIVRELLLSVWAYAEAVVDIRNLVEGNKVPISKDAGTWNITMDKLLESETEWNNIDKNVVSKDSEGFTYKQYLEMLLYSTDKKVVFLRTLDIVQWNIAQVQPDFQFSKSIYQLKVNIKIKSNPLFNLFSFDVQNLSIYDYELQKVYNY